MALATTGTMLAERYRVIRRLGSGGMASVFLAEDERLRRRVAVKRLHAGSPEDVARRFQREARVGASLNHPSIVAVFDTIVDDEGVLIVMEYVDGETLRDEIARRPLAPKRALEVLEPVAIALDHAHANGVVHRDVGPANVLLGRDGAVKPADLGIATAAGVTRITRSGTVLGTVAYMAPERLDGAAGGPPADIYALAAVAFEALTGDKAIAGRTAAEVARRAVLDPPPDLNAALPDAPAAAAAALRRGMAKDPDERPPSASALVGALKEAYADQLRLAPVVPPVERSPGVRSDQLRPAPAVPPVERSPRVRSDQLRPAPAIPPVEQGPDVRAEQPRPAPPPVEPASDTRAEQPRPARPVPPAGRRPPKPAPHNSPRPAARRRLPVVAAIVGALLVCAGVAAAVALTTGGSGHKVAQAPARSRPQPPATSHRRSGGAERPATSTPTGGATPAAGATPGAAATPAAGSPEQALTSFYTLGTRGDIGGSWALGTERVHAEVGGFDSFRGQEASLRSIAFPTLTVTRATADAATVSFRSVAVHTTRTDHCSGSATLVMRDGRWLVDELQGISCTS